MIDLKKPELEHIINKMLTHAQHIGATSAEAAANIGLGFSVTARMGEIDTIEHNRDKNADVTVFVGHKTGSASTSDFSDSALEMCVEKAYHIAKLTSEDHYTGLAEKELLAFNYPNLDLYHPWNLTPEQGITLAVQLENLARSVDNRIINSEGATISNHEYVEIYGNTLGFMGYYPSSQHVINCGLIAFDGHEMHRDFDYTIATDPLQLEDSASLAQRVAKLTLNRLGAKYLKTQQCPVIFAPQVAKSFLGNFIAAISGGNLYRKASFLLDKLQQPIFPDFVTIDERPHLLKATGSVPFDDEGVKTENKDLVNQGILKSYVLSSYSARKLGMRSTGNAGGVHNIFINHSEQNLPELLKQMHTGLLVTEVMGQGVNLVTGDYSRGAFGFWVENGEIQYPVHEITIAGNLKDMFAQIIAVGNDRDNRSNIHTGSILIEKMMVAGK